MNDHLPKKLKKTKSEGHILYAIFVVCKVFLFIYCSEYTKTSL